MMEFFDFINSCGLIDPLLEGGPFTWSSHEDVLVLSRIDRFLFAVEWEGSGSASGYSSQDNV